jgi:hypothetical protein
MKWIERIRSALSFSGLLQCEVQATLRARYDENPPHRSGTASAGNAEVFRRMHVSAQPRFHLPIARGSAQV